MKTSAFDLFLTNVIGYVKMGHLCIQALNKQYGSNNVSFTVYALRFAGEVVTL